MRVAVAGNGEAVELERWLCARKFAELAEAAGSVCIEMRERCKMRKGKAAPVATEVDLPALIAVRREIDGSEPEMEGAAFLVGEPVALQRICEEDEWRIARSGEGAEIGRIVVAIILTWLVGIRQPAQQPFEIQRRHLPRLLLESDGAQRSEALVGSICHRQRRERAQTVADR